jgi:hypothetical protein
MRRPIVSVSVALVASLAAGIGVLAQGFGLRTGSWSFTMTAQGSMPMEGVPPAVRAQIEAELGKPQTFTTCVTAEDLKNLNLGKTPDSDDEDCKTVSAKVTPTVADITRQCSGDEPSTEISHFEAATPQTLKGTVTRKSAAGTMTMNMIGKWVGAKCAE